jgi:Icc-related predicted phosphoesterase
LNPLGLEIARQLAESFNVDAVLDTGDLTSFGYPVESRIGAIIEEFDVPYVFVPGNHDSDANRASLGEVSNVVLADEQIVRIGSVDLVGIADPTFTADNVTGSGEEARIKAALRRHVSTVARRLRPDLLAVHDQRIAEFAYGDVPLVVTGHLHERDSFLDDGTRVLVVGSSGAAGLESFTVDTDVPYESEILRFDRRGRLVAVDYITVRGLEGSFDIDRQLLEVDPGDDA